ncbi:MAG: chemoreceptor glutamine deamidase CheD [Burkholderiaceae bacterium]
MTAHVRPQRAGAPGEAATVLFEREFDRYGVKVLPGEYFVSAQDIVISTVLGSCVAVCLWERERRFGGMNHFMLPGDGGDDRTGLAGRYGLFAMEQLINEVIKRGGRKANLEAKVFGGGAVLPGMTTVNVGERNVRFVEQFLRTEGIPIAARDLLDVHPRRVVFFPQTGRALCKKLVRAEASLIAAERQYTEKLAGGRVGGEVELF